MNENNYPFFFLNVLANFAQLYDLQLNLEQIDNDTIFKELQKQDQILNEQTEELQKQTNIYLKKIIEQNEEILKILKGEK